MPKKPVTRLSGRKIAVSTVSARMMLLVRLLCSEKCICTAVSDEASSRRTCESTRSMCSSTSRERTRSCSRSRRSASSLLLGPLLERVDPFGDRGALVLAGVFEQVQRVARVEQQAPAVAAAARAEQLLLQLVELLGQQPAQLEVAVDHVVRPCAASGRPGWSACARWRGPRRSPSSGCCRRLAKNSRTWQSVGCTVSRTRSKTAKPTGLVSIRSIGRLPRRPMAGPSASIGRRARRRRGAGRRAGRRPRCSRRSRAAAC